jgi:Enolase C-terminal domain-like
VGYERVKQDCVDIGGHCVRRSERSRIDQVFLAATLPEPGDPRTRNPWNHAGSRGFAEAVAASAVVWMASVHLSLNVPNALIQETVRAFFTGWYTELVSGLPVVEGGRVRLGSERPGLGVELLPGLTERKDATVRRSTA